jgi:hypothetical protein
MLLVKGTIQPQTQDESRGNLGIHLPKHTGIGRTWKRWFLKPIEQEARSEERI